MANDQFPKFPMYLMVIDGKRKFFPIQEAGVYFDSGWAKVEIAGLVLEGDFSVRDITSEEARRISEIADRHSEGK